MAHWYLLGISAVLFAALVSWELRASAPFLDIRMLAANKALTRTYLRFGLAMLCLYIVLYGITQWIEAVRGLSETEAGLILLPMTLLSGLVISPVSRRNLVRGPVIAAAAACLVGSACVLILSGSAWLGWIVVIALVFGLVTGFASAGNQTALYSQAPAEQLGTASGLLRTFGYVGSIASSAITGIVFHASVSDGGIHRIAWIMTGISLVLVLISVFDRTLPSKAGSALGRGLVRCWVRFCRQGSRNGPNIRHGSSAASRRLGGMKRDGDCCHGRSASSALAWTAPARSHGARRNR